MAKCVQTYHRQHLISIIDTYVDELRNMIMEGIKWVTREKAKVDRIACPWLIKKFVDSKPDDNKTEHSSDIL